MRVVTAGLVFCLLLPTCVTDAHARRPPPEHNMKPARPTEAPLVLDLSLADGLQLVARVKNVSAAAQSLLHGEPHQPSVLVLASLAGQPIVAFDERRIAKHDSRVYCADFQTLAPGATAPLDSARFQREPGGYQLQWGPFRMTDIPPGVYTARLTFRSAITQCMDEETGKQRPCPGVWLGQVESNTVRVTLP